MRYNRIETHIDSHGVEGSVGVRICGQRNLMVVNVAQTAPGQNLIFEPEAKDNLVYALNLPNGMTNNATAPTNRIITAWPVGHDVPTPHVPASGEDVTNRNPYPVQVTILTTGRVSDWTETDAQGNSHTVSARLLPGQKFELEPGESIRFTYSAAPTWVWKGLS